MPEPSTFDQHSAEATEDIVGYYAKFRESCPIGRSAAYGGFVYLTRFADVFEAARDDERFSSTREEAQKSVDNNGGTAIVLPRKPFGDKMQYPLELDPPDNIEYRILLDTILTNAEVEKIRPMIARHASRLVDEFIERGSADLIHDLATPLPSAVTLDWLGFPEEDWAKIGHPIHDSFTSIPGSERALKAIEGLTYLDKRISELIVERRANPKDDVISYLVQQTKSDGSRFTDEELLSVIGIAVVGGVDTTTSLTGSVLVHLDEHPEIRQQIIDTPDLLIDGTNEFLRRYGSVTAMARTITRDTEIGGCPVKAGERILLPWLAANHDPEVFSNPTELRLDRDASRHLAFGTGAHRCPGSHLARAMFREMIHQVLTRLPDYKVDRDGLVGYPSRGNHQGWDVVPVTFTPGAPVGDKHSQFAETTGYQKTTFEVSVEAIEPVADDVVRLRLNPRGGNTLPQWAPGAHLELRLPSGRLRQYSLCGRPADRQTYEIAVLREQNGRGGSVEIHDEIQVGSILPVRGPRNHFPLIEADRYLFLAGGIGVTPMLAMARQASELGKPVRFVYGGRSKAAMAFIEDLQALSGVDLVLVPQDTDGMPNLAAELGAIDVGTGIYCCGPSPMIAAVEETAAVLGCEDQVHVERFEISDEMEALLNASTDNKPFVAVLARSNIEVEVPANRRLIEVLRDVGLSVDFDCEKGICGSCETRVLDGELEHRDFVLSKRERDEGKSMMICVSRACSDKLVLDM